MRPEVLDLAPGQFAVEAEHPAAPDARQAAKAARGFIPTKRQRAYLEAWLDPQAPKSIKGIANYIGVARSNITYWLNKPEFVEWFNAEMDRATDHAWRPVLARLGQLALQGSVEHAKLLAQIRGAIRNPDEPARGGVTVVVGIPRAGDQVQVPSEPRPSLPAPRSEHEH